ncbi:eukaryotic porin-domain-containing protein [Melampsora americana]|nr:eukaryotic porin-domain-containing protein [Melampsora americana]
MSNQSVNLNQEITSSNSSASQTLDSFNTPTINKSNLVNSFSPLNNFLNRISSWRDSLNLPEPGTYEQVGREIKGVHLTNYIFDGARAELSKALSLNPAFNVTHSFNLGAQGGSAAMGGVNPGTYNFGAMYATNKIFAQGSIDNDATLMGRLNYRWPTEQDISKLQIQWPTSSTSPSVTQLEHDRRGQDYSLSFKIYNPNPIDKSGIFITQYLQSLHSRLSFGIESVWQIQPPMEDASLSYLLKWTSPQKDWISTLNLSGQGILQATYWQKLSEKVEAGLDLVCLPHPSPSERKALTTFGVRYDLRQATIRSQIDSHGKVSMLLEQRIAPTFTFSIAGELDHFKSQSKFGIGIQLESSPLDENALQGVTPPTPPM